MSLQVWRMLQKPLCGNQMNLATLSANLNHLKNGLDWGMEDEVMEECPKLKQYFGVDTLLIQRISGPVRLHTKDEDETFTINCSKTKFSISLLQKALEGAEKQRATPRIYQQRIGHRKSRPS